MTRRLDRRTVLAGGGAILVGGVALDRRLGTTRQAVKLPPLRPGLPASQHAWNAALRDDGHGGAIAPFFHRVLLFDVRGRPGRSQVRRLEAAMRTLEHRHPYGHGGLLTALGWSPRYFERVIGTRSPLDRARSFASDEVPDIDPYDVCLHLASDHEPLLTRTVAALEGHGHDTALDLQTVLQLRAARSGFSGSGLPAQRAAHARVPGYERIPRDAPLFMGFKSGYRKNQATERDVTIRTGPFAGGTTMMLSQIRLRLDEWYHLLDERARVARMFSPQTSPAEVSRFTNDARSNPDDLDEAARRFGVVGHAQASAAGRVSGAPRILRRDFDTVDGGQAGVHFISLQRSIADFAATRRAMNAARASFINPAVTAEINNGIKEFMVVLRRGTYLVPPRADRSFPLLPQREAMLAAA